jgi:hypothetical protein
MVSQLHSVTEQLGIVAVQIPLPERALAFLNRALGAIQAAQMDEHPVPTPTRQVLEIAPQDISEDGDVEWLQTLPAAPQVDASCVLPADDSILCDADNDSESEDLDGEDLDDGEDLNGEDLDGEYRCIPWNRDTQDMDMVGNNDFARDDEVWEQAIPDIHHDFPPAVLLPRVQSQDELDRMHHLGAAYFGAENQPLQIKFKTAFGSLSTPKMGEKETGVSNALRPPGRCRSPPLWRPPRCSDLADKRFATSRPSSPPVWKPVPLSQSVLTSPVLKTNGLYGHVAQSTTRLQLAPPRPMFNGTMGSLPSIPPSTVLIEDALTGRVQATQFSQVFADALFNDNSDQALRPKNPMLLLAFAEAAQHSMQACVPKTTDAKNKTGWRLLEPFLFDIGGNTPPLRQPDSNPRHMLREQLLKNIFILWCRTKCTSSLPG